MRSLDEYTRADIYLGLDKIRNISAINPKIKLNFSEDPELDCRSEDELTFNPNTGRALAMRVCIVSCIGSVHGRP